MVGTLHRSAPISMPGTILSQFGRQMMASKQWARTTVSTESAINSRDGSENRIPKWPIAIPSSTPIVLNSKGTPPRFSNCFFYDSTEFLKMNVTRDQVDIRVTDPNERSVKVFVRLDHAGGSQQTPVRGPLVTFGDCIAVPLCHECFRFFPGLVNPISKCNSAISGEGLTG